MTKSSRNEKALTVHVPEELHDLLSAYARRDGVSTSAFARDILRAAVQARFRKDLDVSQINLGAHVVYEARINGVPEKYVQHLLDQLGMKSLALMVGEIRNLVAEASLFKKLRMARRRSK